MSDPGFLKTLKRLAALLLLALVPALLAAYFHPKAPNWTEEPVIELTWEQAKKLTPLWVDARKPALYAAGHLEGSLSLTEAEWEQGLPALVAAWNPGRMIVVYCDGGNCETSRYVAKRLRRELGIEEVTTLKDGYPAAEAVKTSR